MFYWSLYFLSLGKQFKFKAGIANNDLFCVGKQLFKLHELLFYSCVFMQYLEKKPELWLTFIKCCGFIKYTPILRSNKKNCQDNFSSITRIFSYIFQIFPFHIYFSEIWDMRTWDMWIACLKTFRNNRICYVRNQPTF